MLGTTPSMLMRASCTNSQKGRPVGAPSNSAIVARLSSAAKTSHGPIIQPRLDGQAATLPGLRSWPPHAFTAGLHVGQGVKARMK